MNKKTILIIAVMAIAAAIVFAYSQAPRFEKPPENIPCGMTNCHGFDVSCGQPVQCELVYQYGDNCRRFTHCAVVNGTCQSSIEKRFEECKSCVVGCAPLLETDYLKGMECEYKCTL